MNYKIMIIEDDPDIAELVSRHLEKFGFTIEKCIEFHNVLKEFEKAKPHLVRKNQRKKFLSDYFSVFP